MSSLAEALHDAVPTPASFAPPTLPPPVAGLPVSVTAPVQGVSPIIDEEKLTKMLAERMRVMDEFLQTETTYLQDLKSLKKIYLDPLCKDPELLAKDDFNIIFSNIQTITELHDKLFPDLKTAIEDGLKKGEMKQFTATFRRIVDFFNMYSIYCSNRTNAIATQDKCTKKNAKFDKFLTEQETRFEPLDSFLIKPVQRLCRYPLLLQAMLSKTPENHPEREGLAKTLERVNLVAIHVNEFSRKRQSEDVIFELTQRLTGLEEPLTVPGRSFVMERESVYVVAKFTRFKREELHLVVFSDCIIFSKPKKKKLIFKHKTTFDHLSWRLPETIVDTEWPIVLIDESTEKSSETTLIEPTKRARDALHRAFESCKKSVPVKTRTLPKMLSIGVPSPRIKKSSSSEGLQTPRTPPSSATTSSGASSNGPPAAPSYFPPPPLVRQNSSASQRRHTITLESDSKTMKFLNSLEHVPEEKESVSSPGKSPKMQDFSSTVVTRRQLAAETLREAKSRRNSMPPRMNNVTELLIQQLQEEQEKMKAQETQKPTESEETQTEKTSPGKSKFRLSLDKKAKGPTLAPPSAKKYGTVTPKSVAAHGFPTSKSEPKVHHVDDSGLPPVSAKRNHHHKEKEDHGHLEDINRLTRENQQLKDRVAHLETALNLMAAAMKGIESAANGTRGLWNIVPLSSQPPSK